MSEVMECITRNRGTQFKIWVPDDLHDWLKEAAKQEERSMTYLVVKALRAAKEKSDGTT